MTKWSTPDDVRTRLRRRWDTGEFLANDGRGEPFIPIDLPIRGPTAGELGARFAETDAWARSWAPGAGPYSVQTKLIGARRTGANAIPVRFRIDSFDDLAAFLDTADDVRLYRKTLAAAETFGPPLYRWALDRPVPALAHHAVFDRLLRCVRWVTENAQSDVYLRQVDAPGVDTKFIEQHRTILRELLDQVISAPADPSSTDLSVRYGFRQKPSRVRIRLLDNSLAPWHANFTDIQVTTDELSANPFDVDRVFLVENEVTCLAFPPVAKSLLIFGGGYAISRVGGLHWLANTDLIYWGDIDTHGLRILDLMRSRFPHTRSILMDRATLLAHEPHWDREPSPVNVDLRHLTDQESSLYRDLVEDTLGAAVRLEQERVGFGCVRAAITGL